jgi:uncharacterized integral membrane protein
MRYLIRAVWLFVFLVLFAFAVANTGTSELRFFGDFVWRAPLVVLLLVFFIGGFVFGVLALLPGLVRMRMELRRLKRAGAIVPAATIAPGYAVPPDNIQSVAQGARTTS